MSSTIEICNLALSLLGQSPITSLMTPTTKIEQLCALNYPSARNAVLESHNWTFAVGRATLSTPQVLTPEWGMNYAFTLPADSLRVIWCGRSTNEAQYDLFDWRIEDVGLVTNEEVVYIRYIRQIEDASKFSALFVQALAARLAMEMATPITENVALYKRMMEMYAVKVGEAAANDGMQGRSQVIKQKILSSAR